MKKGSKFIILLLIVIMLLFTSCSAYYKDGVDSDVTDNFLESLTAMDFSSAYKYFWKYAKDGSEETFISDCEYIINKLEVSSITVSNDVVVSEGEKKSLNYDITLHTQDAGDIASSCSINIVNEDGKTYLVYSKNPILEDFEHNDIITRVAVKGKRGEVFTCDGKVIAENSYADTVYFSVTEDTDFKSIITKVDGILDLSQEELAKIKTAYESAVENNYGSVIIKEYSRGTLSEDVISELTDIDGVYIDNSSMTYQRYYPYDNAYSHLLGYANSPNEEQIKYISSNGYSPSSVWGKEGIEKAYNDEMLSKDGYAYQLRRDTYEIKRTLYISEAQDGKDVILTIDSGLQEQAYQLLSEKLDDDQAASVVVLNGSTGAVLAQASAPGYNPNLFSFGISDEDYKALSEDELSPLYNRVTQGLYPPGSTIKPFTAIAAINNNVCSFNTEFPYTIVDNSWTPPNNWHWLPIKRDDYVSAPVNMYKAMVKSDNIYFAWLGLEMGYDALSSYFTRVGIGEAIDYDLPTSTSNLINDDAQKNGTMLADMSFGHGQLLVTPLQMAAMYTAFQNDGDMLNPYLVEYLGENSSEEYITSTVGAKSIWKENAIPSEYLPYLNKMFKGVVEEGTATMLKTSGTTIYAKTGTAIKGDEKDKRISWVVAWTPDSEDSRIVVVTIETPPQKGNVKFEIAKSLLLQN